MLHTYAMRYRLINAVYTNNSGMTMSEHFAEQVESMQSLTIAFSERDLVNAIMRHYATDIQRLWLTRTEEVSIMSGAKFLRSIEQNIVENPKGFARDIVGSGYRGRRYNGSQSTRPVVATITSNRWDNRRGSNRGRGYRQSRSGYRASFNRPALSEVERARPAIAFVKEGEGSTLSKNVGEGPSKN